MLVSDSMPCPEECYEAFSVARVHERLGKLPSFETSSTFSGSCVDLILHNALKRAAACPRSEVTAGAQQRPISLVKLKKQ